MAEATDDVGRELLACAQYSLKRARASEDNLRLMHPDLAQKLAPAKQQNIARWERFVTWIEAQLARSTAPPKEKKR